MKTEDMSSQTHCNTCGQAIPEVAEGAYETASVEAQGSPSMTFNDEAIQAATKVVVQEVLKVISPLLEKLEEASKQQQQEQQTVETKSEGMNYEQQLDQMKLNAMERLKLQEQKVAAKMQKMQSRFTGRA